MRDRTRAVGAAVAAALILYVVLPILVVDALALASLRTPVGRASAEHELTTIVVAALWPVLLGTALWFFRRPLLALAGRGIAHTGDAAPSERLARERAIAATAHLVAAQRAPREVDNPAIGLLETQAIRAVGTEAAGPQVPPSEIASLVGSLITPASVRAFEKRLVLWLDADPTAHVELICALEALEIRVDTALSTEDALVKLELRRYDLLVADERRAAEDRAGLPFAAAVRRRDATIPIVAPSGGPVRLFETLTRQLLAGAPR
jgi:hypothetical protein